MVAPSVPEHLARLPLIDLDEYTIGRKVDYWRDWWDHQTNDAWWQQFHHRPDKLGVPIFQQGGWFDPYSGSHLRTFAKIGDRLPNRVLMGPWSHEEEVETFKGDVDMGPQSVTVIPASLAADLTDSAACWASSRRFSFSEITSAIPPAATSTVARPALPSPLRERRSPGSSAAGPTKSYSPAAGPTATHWPFAVPH